MTSLTALARCVARQHHVVSTAQLYALGWSKSGVRHLAAAERIFRVYRGVYVFGRPTLTREARWMAAVLAAPTGAALGLVSAAVSLELLQYESAWPHVIVPAGRSNRGRHGINVHRSSDLTEDDSQVRAAIRTTTVLRTLRDLARNGLADRPLNAAVRQAGRLHRADLQQLAREPRLGRIVRLYDPLIGMTESDFEARFLAVCTRFRLPAPTPQLRFGSFRVDFAWERHRLAVECDSRRWHDNDVNHLTDRRKERLIRARGFELLRFTWAEVVHEPAVVAAEIRQALVARQAQLAIP